MGSRAVPVEPPKWDEAAVLAKSRQVGEYQIKVITPIFGGSEEAGKVNSERPIRASAIRGHLRFWWRALYAGQYQDVEKMFQAEAGLFGSTERPSAFDVVIKSVKCGAVEPCADWPNGKDSPRHQRWSLPYAAFPFQGTSGCKHPQKGMREAQFTLSILRNRGFADGRVAELEHAIRAWVWLGGYGARTRRGCGALECDKLPLEGLDGLKELVTSVGELDGHPRKVPVLRGARVVVGTPQCGAADAWKAAVEIYQRLRQGPGVGRNPGQGNGPGRSRWPEPDAIRKLTSRHAPGHEPQHPAGNAFPRADLGLPIVFHFKDDGDPDSQVLQGSENGLQRMASPVITRPLALANGQYAPMVLVLNAPRVWEGRGIEICGRSLSRDNIAGGTISEHTPPLRDCGASDARDAVIKYVSSQWGVQEVVL